MTELGMTEPGRPVRVAVTREAGCNAELVSLLAARGAVGVPVPLIGFAPALTAAGLHAALHGPPGWLLLTSPQGARALADVLGPGRLGIRPGGWQVAAVGEGTARALRGLGFVVDFVSSRGDAAALGATLPAPPGARALHLTSLRSQGTMQNALEARGVVYARAELYRTEAAALSPEVLATLRAADAVALASGSAAQALADAAGVNFAVAVLGEQSARVTRQLGFTRLELAREPTLPALADAALSVARRGLRFPGATPGRPARTAS